MTPVNIFLTSLATETANVRCTRTRTCARVNIDLEIEILADNIEIYRRSIFE